jgi:hypothetical protein
MQHAHRRAFSGSAQRALGIGCVDPSGGRPGGSRPSTPLEEGLLSGRGLERQSALKSVRHSRQARPRRHCPDQGTGARARCTQIRRTTAPACAQVSVRLVAAGCPGGLGVVRGRVLPRRACVQRADHRVTCAPIVRSRLVEPAQIEPPVRVPADEDGYGSFSFWAWWLNPAVSAQLPGQSFGSG